MTYGVTRHFVVSQPQVPYFVADQNLHIPAVASAEEQPFRLDNHRQHARTGSAELA